MFGPQSLQSVPKLQVSYAEPGPPSSHSWSSGCSQELSHPESGGGEGGGGEAMVRGGNSGAGKMEGVRGVAMGGGGELPGKQDT